MTLQGWLASGLAHRTISMELGLAGRHCFVTGIGPGTTAALAAEGALNPDDYIDLVKRKLARVLLDRAH